MARTGRDLAGQKFGKLTVLGFGGYEQNKRRVWRCGIVIVTAEMIVRWKVIFCPAAGGKAVLYPAGSRPDGRRKIWKTGGSVRGSE